MPRPLPRPDDHQGPGPHRQRVGTVRRGPEGEVQVFGSNEQNDVDVDVARWTRLARQALRAEGVDGEAELSLLFVDEGTMAGLNERFMDKSGPTDVLAFPIDEVGPVGRWPDASTSGPDREDDLEDLPLILGDVVICPTVAVRQADEHERPPEDEIALLVVHGILHILGHDHAEPEEAARMRAREKDLLRQFHRAD